MEETTKLIQKLRNREHISREEVGLTANNEGYYPRLESKIMELKCCPFCGSTVELKKEPICGYGGCYSYSIRCDNCGCELDYEKNDTVYRSDEEAINNVIPVWNKRASAPIEEAQEINEIINQAFLNACKYLQRNPPAELEDYSIEELNALAGAGSYEDGYKQWANYFINNAIKNSKHED